jgi:hypothetical protein
VHNTFAGYGAGNLTLTGDDNTAVGAFALSAVTTGRDNTAVGAFALSDNTTGSLNYAFGYAALSVNTTGWSNIAVGYAALRDNTTGSNNTAVGYGALTSEWKDTQNVAIGPYALYSLVDGDDNTAIGALAGWNLQSGSDNIYIGHFGLGGESNTTRIGDSQTATYVAGIHGATVTDRAVYVNADGRLGTLSSSRRYKEEILDMDAESDVLLKLRPVSFYYRKELDETHLRQFGLVAEEVAEVAPGLVAYDEDGTPQAVRYHFVNAMLLNEVQKQRRLVEDERRANDAQQTIIEDLKARLAKLEAALAGDR